MKATTISLDSIDRTLLDALQANARISNAELARQVDLSPSGLQKRLRKLQSQNLIRKFTTILNRQALGFDMLCIVHITLNRHTEDGIENFRTVVQDIPEVQECYQMTGMDDYMLKIIVQNVEHLEQFLTHTLTPIPAVDRFRTSIVLKEIKSSTAIPIKA